MLKRSYVCSPQSWESSGRSRCRTSCRECSSIRQSHQKYSRHSYPHRLKRHHIYPYYCITHSGSGNSNPEKLERRLNAHDNKHYLTISNFCMPTWCNVKIFRMFSLLKEKSHELGFSL